MNASEFYGYPQGFAPGRMLDPLVLNPAGRARCILDLDFRAPDGAAKYTMMTGVNWSNWTLERCIEGVGLELENSGNASTIHRAKLVPIPASGDFDAILTYRPIRGMNHNFNTGLYLTDGVTAGAGNQLLLAGGSGSNAGQAVRAVWRYTNFTTFAATHVADMPWNSAISLVLLRRLSGVYQASWSRDGRFWTHVQTPLSPSGTSAYVGFGMQVVAAATQHRAVICSFRIFQPGIAADSIGIFRKLGEIRDE